MEGNGVKGAIKECIGILNEIATNANIIEKIEYCDDSDDDDSIDGSLLINDKFRNEMYSMLQALLSYYNTNDYYEEKYMMLLLHLIFGINPPLNNNIAQSSALSPLVLNGNTKYKLKPRHKEPINIITITQGKMNLHFQSQHSNIVSLMHIILTTIKLIECKTSNQIEEYTEEQTEGIIEDIEENFETSINDFFLEHFSLFNQSLHQLTETLYNSFDYEITIAKDYVLFMKILLVNQANFTHLIIAKFNRIIEHFDKDDLELLSLKEMVDFSSEYDIIKTNRRLKALEYINQQRLNNEVVMYEDIRYVNKHFLTGKYKVTEQVYEMVYNKDTKGDEVNTEDEGKGDGKAQKDKEVNRKEIISRHVIKIKNDIRKLNDNYQRDIAEVKEIIDNIQSRYSINITHLMNDLTELELKNEKYL